MVLLALASQPCWYGWASALGSSAAWWHSEAFDMAEHPRSVSKTEFALTGFYELRPESPCAPRWRRCLLLRSHHTVLVHREVKHLGNPGWMKHGRFTPGRSLNCRRLFAPRLTRRKNSTFGDDVFVEIGESQANVSFNSMWLV